jgi:hypothetical protein
MCDTGARASSHMNLPACLFGPNKVGFFRCGPVFCLELFRGLDAGTAELAEAWREKKKRPKAKGHLDP